MQEEIHKGLSQNFSSKMTGPVFITGGTGFIGSYIIKSLVEKGYAVRAIRRSNKRPFYIPADVLDKVQWVD
jgi:nucleoside-diphosphate-sugar epimerase